MGDLHRARARADAFAHAVDSGPRHSQHGIDDAEFAVAVQLVDRLRTVGATVTPRPAFSADLRRRLLDEAAARAASVTPIVLHSGNEFLEILDEAGDEPAATATVTDLHSRSRKQLRLVAATAALVVLGGGIGSAAAAQQAMPGDALYGFKRSIETVATNVSVGDGSRGRRELGHAMTRLAEVRALNAEGVDAAILSTTLDDFSSQARKGVSRLVAAYQQDGDEASIETVNTFITDARRQLVDLTPALPDGAFRSALEAVTTVDNLAAHARAACPKCGRPATLTSTAPTPSDSPSARPSEQPAGQPSPSGTTTRQPPLVSSSPLPSTSPGQNQTPGQQTTVGPIVPLPSTTYSPDPRKPTTQPSTPWPTVKPTTPHWPFPSLAFPSLPLPPWLTLPPWLHPRR